MMSNDTIYRQAAIDAICEDWCEVKHSKCRHPFDQTKDDHYFCDGCFDVSIIEDLPSADRPQGEWIEIGNISHSYKCSVCGRTIFHTTVGKNHVAEYYPYCHCGAKMKGADDE